MKAYDKATDDLRKLDSIVTSLKENPEKATKRYRVCDCYSRKASECTEHISSMQVSKEIVGLHFP